MSREALRRPWPKEPSRYEASSGVPSELPVSPSWFKLASAPLWVGLRRGRRSQSGRQMQSRRARHPRRWPGGARVPLRLEVVLDWVVIEQAGKRLSPLRTRAPDFEIVRLQISSHPPTEQALGRLSVRAFDLHGYRYFCPPARVPVALIGHKWMVDMRPSVLGEVSRRGPRRRRARHRVADDQRQRHRAEPARDPQHRRHRRRGPAGGRQDRRRRDRRRPVDARGNRRDTGHRGRHAPRRLLAHARRPRRERGLG